MEPFIVRCGETKRTKTRDFSYKGEGATHDTRIVSLHSVFSDPRKDLNLNGDLELWIGDDKTFQFFEPGKRYTMTLAPYEPPPAEPMRAEPMPEPAPAESD